MRGEDEFSFMVEGEASTLGQLFSSVNPSFFVVFVVS
jgi:hypothetical protein